MMKLVRTFIFALIILLPFSAQAQEGEGPKTAPPSRITVVHRQAQDMADAFLNLAMTKMKASVNPETDTCKIEEAIHRFALTMAKDLLNGEAAGAAPQIMSESAELYGDFLIYMFKGEEIAALVDDFLDKENEILFRLNVKPAVRYEISGLIEGHFDEMGSIFESLRSEE